MATPVAFKWQGMFLSCPALPCEFMANTEMRDCLPSYLPASLTATARREAMHALIMKCASLKTSTGVNCGAK